MGQSWTQLRDGAVMKFSQSNVSPAVTLSA